MYVPLRKRETTLPKHSLLDNTSHLSPSPSPSHKHTITAVFMKNVYAFSSFQSTSSFITLPSSLVMWSSGEETHQNNKNRASSSSSKSSSSTSSCHSPFSSSPHLPTQRKKTMEEVWKDISLTSLQDHPTREEGPGSSSGFRNVILQDFLARPFKETSSTAVPDIDMSLFGPAPPPPTVLSLNSGPDFHCLDAMGFNQNQKSSHIRPVSHQSFNNSSSASLSTSIFDGSPPVNLFDSFRSGSGNKRMSDSDNNCNDRRHKRMIKNRESAARSRARKQAWVSLSVTQIRFVCVVVLFYMLGFFL